MNNIDVIASPGVSEKFNNYPQRVKGKILELRELILKTAMDTDGIEIPEETLKWGEPAYVVKGGSTLRIDWKQKSPNNIKMFFNCRTLLIPTFREVFGELLTFEGNRAIVLSLKEELPVEILKKCIVSAFNYQKIKNLPMLGL